jgi:hypothetical protein
MVVGNLAVVEATESSKMKTKIKKSFLDSLIGLSINQAEVKIKQNGNKVTVNKVGVIEILLAVGNTVKLYHEEDSNIVAEVSLGDPFQLEMDIKE